jgi:hypothetical protein
MANLKENRQKIKEEFTYFLSKVAKSSRFSKESGDSLGESSISSYLLFIEPERLFDYNPEEWKSISSMYDITDPSIVDDIQSKLLQDKEFLKHDKNDNYAFRSNALSHYKHFLYARDYFKRIADEDKKEDIQSTKKLLKETNNIVDFWGFVLKVILKYDENLSKLEERLNYNTVTVGFKFCRFGKKVESLKLVTDPRRQDDCDTSITWVLKGDEYCFLKEQTLQSLEIFANNINEIYGDKYLIEIDNNSYRLYELDSRKNEQNTDVKKEEGEDSPLEFGDFTPRQIIYYGAPGTGKSHTIKKEEDEGKITCIRTTFHPDSDYATFVGCYKPHKIKDSQCLTYEFVEQAFLEAYKQAWMNPEKEIALVIEEINRGNCAQVFGDIFQLLDRSDDGWSTYPIKADTDIAEHLKELRIPGYAASMNKRFGLDKEGKDRYPDRDWFGFMALPPNMSILATMNTSDQSLFPIDSAFKRRWDWKYIKIKKGKKENGEELGWNIQIKDANGEPVKIIDENTTLSWWNFIQKVNEIIASMTSSADKQLGYFFCKPSEKANETDEKPTIITADTLVGKVIFYLWNDVFKDYGFEDASLFTYQEEKNGKKTEKDLAFADFYDEEGELVNTVRLVDFLNRIMKWQNNNTENE